ncbi:patatin-like phospholipase family protein [Methanobacterium sp.]|uniref:patatin-like phospholipase family protein n=1 Tax=Methanobacterium sp. TaxID=2164 RepID=UPI002ABB6F2A|nr:patatin-like phospholipase family protein [Methanobacterium sp.]MDY9923544.1 patatin-like phospholipase family protein [Methanobacterium sp.]
MAKKDKPSKALVLSGGGITGTAWELGILFGLEESGVDVTHAELIVGTSAGSSVGAQITSGLSLEELYNLQLKPVNKTVEKQVDFEGHKFRQMMAAAIMSSPDSQTARALIGEAALAAPTMEEDERLKIMASRLPVHEWNQERKLIINAVDAETGEWVKFDQDSNVPLLLAVSASSAVPGVYPPTTINGRRYIDGGMSSGTNADVARGYDQVFIIVAEPNMIAPAMGPTMHRITFEEELAHLETSGSQVMVITPDEESLQAKGPNPLDANFRGVSAQAGRKQGQKIAGEVKLFWEIS